MPNFFKLSPPGYDLLNHGSDKLFALTSITDQRGNGLLKVLLLFKADRNNKVDKRKRKIEHYEGNNLESVRFRIIEFNDI